MSGKTILYTKHHNYTPWLHVSRL